jgi:hypothetical protein
VWGANNLWKVLGQASVRYGKVGVEEEGEVFAWTYGHQGDYYATIEVTLHMYKRFKDLISK